jgi:hypothetical protein
VSRKVGEGRGSVGERGLVKRGESSLALLTLYLFRRGESEEETGEGKEQGKGGGGKEVRGEIRVAVERVKNVCRRVRLIHILIHTDMGRQRYWNSPST